jgi:hypothetical protein
MHFCSQWSQKRKLLSLLFNNFRLEYVVKQVQVNQAGMELDVSDFGLCDVNLSGENTIAIKTQKLY